MTNPIGELGVQSYCFRGFKENSTVAGLVREIGVAAIELCGVHVDFSDENAFDAAIAAYRDRGVRIVSIGVQALKNEPAKEEKYFEFVRRAGCAFMSVNFVPDSVPAAFRTAERLADKYDIRLAIHNHGGHHWLGNRQMLQHVFANTSARIGLCLDTAWALTARENPVALVETFADRLYGVHIKDFVFDTAGKPADVVVGTGNVDLRLLQAALRAADFNGYAVLEYEGDVDNPVPALKQCVEAVARNMV